MNVDFGALLSSGFVPGWLAFSLIVIWYLRTKAANKTADAAIKDGDWKRLIDWNQRLQNECETCHRERDEARAEALRWKAIAEGIGENRQEAAALLAAERLAEDARKKGGEA